MTTIEFANNGNTPFEKLIGHNVQILEKWNSLEENFFENTGLDSNLMEQVRRTLAFGNGCEYCMVKGGRPEFSDSDLKTSVAVSFAELFCKDHRSILKAHFDMFREFFSDKEISELCAFISFINASQKLGKIFNLTEEYQKNPVVRMEQLVLLKE
ncbi:carboxymuconolactone decarboxylase family protein [Chryseobacterium soli]|uniref:carboxymuconolactone decarboxylase family protein n=1 Tax=Chryseobacterium soli TaxID=445961 RepID=UPI002955A75D|nr:carboxymuconolactone decarboxylase family protein [Chryseobacterium soli]MDV7696208.1 carboxymuconolactone decarboxylase family protein [Chryseobacterium soli]